MGGERYFWGPEDVELVKPADPAVPAQPPALPVPRPVPEPRTPRPSR